MSATTPLRVGAASLVADLCASRSRLGALGAQHARSRWVRARNRAVFTVAAATGMVVAGADAAVADGKAPSNPFLAGFVIRDTHGLSTLQYQMSVDGGGWTDPFKATCAGLLVNAWDTYRLIVGVALWLLDVAMQFKPVDWLLPPATAAAAALNQVVHQLGLVPALLTLAVLISFGWMWQGRYGAATSEIVVSMVVAALIGTAIANPVAVVHTAITGARDFGVATSAQIVTGGRAGGESGNALQQQTSAKLVDVFVRQPHQMINYGALLDGRDAKCAAVYDKVLAKGPYASDDSTARDAVGGCNTRYGDAAGNPAGGLLSMGFVSVAGLFLILLFVILTVLLFLLIALALWEAGKFVLSLLKAIIPGTGREGLIVSACTVLVSLLLMSGLLIGISVFLLVVTAAFSATNSWDPAQAFVALDLVIAASCLGILVTFVRAKKHGQKLGSRVHKAMSPRPTAMPSRSLSGQGLTMAATLGGQALAARATAARLVDKAGLTAGGAAATGSAASGGPATGAGAGGGGARGVAVGPPRPAAVRVAAATGKAAWVGTKVALASTVGAPVYAPRAATQAAAALSAGKTALSARLSAAQTTARDTVAAKVDQATDFSAEYAHNVAAAGKFVSKITGTTALAGAAVDAGAPPAAAGIAAASLALGGRRLASEQPSAAAPAGRPPAQVRPAIPAKGVGSSKTPAPVARRSTTAAAASAAPEEALPITSAPRTAGSPASALAELSPAALPALVGRPGDPAPPTPGSPRARLMDRLATERRTTAQPSRPAAPPRRSA